MAIFGYGRVSTVEQTTKNQRLELQEMGYQIEDEYWYADEGISGKTPAKIDRNLRRCYSKFEKARRSLSRKLIG